MCQSCPGKHHLIAAGHKELSRASNMAADGGGGGGAHLQFSTSPLKYEDVDFVALSTEDTCQPQSVVRPRGRRPFGPGLKATLSRQLCN